MKRPQSAKPGYKGYWAQASSDEIGEQNPQGKHQHRQQVKIMKPDLTTHDFGRILPKKIHQDKERLYSQALQLKQTVNELMEQNIRLKTKISILQKQKDKMNRYIDSTSEGLSRQGNSRLNIYGTKSTEKQNMIVRNLKKIVRESRQQNEYLKSENQKIKKMIKYTKINELQIERQVILDENKRLGALLEQCDSQIVNQDALERENEQLKKYLEEEVEQNKSIAEENQKFQEIVQSLEEKIKSEGEKFANREKKLQRDLALEKRKTNEQNKCIEDLRKELKNLQANQQQANMKKKAAKPIIRPASSHPANYRSNLVQPKENTLNVPALELESNEVKKKNEQLERELKEIKLKLQKSQNELSRRKIQEIGQKRDEAQLSEVSPQKPVALVEEPQRTAVIQQKDELSAKPKAGPSKLEKKYQFEDSPSKVEQQEYSHAFEPEAESEGYEQQFEKIDDSKVPKEQKKQQKKVKEDEQIQKLKKDFQQNQEQEELYKKDQDNAKKKKEKGGDKKKKKEKVDKDKAGYKPDKKLLSEIKELLTYRMKSQRYPFDDLKADIENAESSTFSYQDLCNMLVNEPFYLTSAYTKAFLSYCYEKESIKQGEQLASAVLISKIRKVIEDFELMEEDQEKEMITRIAEMTSTYPYELETAFENIKNGEDTVSKQNLIEMFQKLELEDKYIELIIAELSLCSDDLEHLNFHGFFERFYVQEQGLGDPNAIEEQGEQSEQSHKNTSRVKKKSKVTRKASEELQQKMGQYMLAPEQPIESKSGVYDEDIVSDDGRI